MVGGTEGIAVRGASIPHMVEKYRKDCVVQKSGLQKERTVEKEKK